MQVTQDVKIIFKKSFPKNKGDIFLHDKNP
jgi:hypothetical protein